MNYISQIHPALSKTYLNIFGGPYSIEEFREKSQKSSQ